MLKWTFGADTGPFKRGLDSMRQQTSGLAGSLKGQLAGALGLGVITAQFRGLFKEMDRVQKLGIKFGESAETIQKVGLAADLAGSNIEVVSKAMQTATRNALEAANGLETYAETFRALDINAEEFVNMPMEEKLIELAKAMESGAGDGEKLANIIKLMGGRAAEIIPLLKQGSEELRTQFKETNTVAQAQVDAMAEANDRITKLKQTWTTFLATVVGGFQLIGSGFKFVFNNLVSVASSSMDLITSTLVSGAGVIAKVLTFDLSGAKKAFVEYKDSALKTTKELSKAVAEQTKKTTAELDKILTPTNAKKTGSDAALFDPDAAMKAAKEQKKAAEDLKKLKAEVAKLEEDARVASLSAAERLSELQKNRADALSQIVVDEMHALAIKKEVLGIDKEISSIQEKRTAAASKEEDERKSKLTEIRELEKEADMRRLTTAEKITALEEERLRLIELQKQGGDVALDARKDQLNAEEDLESLREQKASEDEKTASEATKSKKEIADLENQAPSLVTSSLAAVGGGGPAAMFGEGQIEQKKVDLLQDIRDLLAGQPDGPKAPQEPTA